VFIADSLQCLGEVLLFVVAGVFHNFRDKLVFDLYILWVYIEVDVDLDNVAQHVIFLEFVLYDELSVSDKTSGINEGLEDVAEEGDYVTQECLREESLGTPLTQLFEQLYVGGAVVEGRLDLMRQLL
jgi:hypothetical protein